MSGLVGFHIFACMMKTRRNKTCNLCVVLRRIYACSCANEKENVSVFFSFSMRVLLTSFVNLFSFAKNHAQTK